jgi:hypothetical protein
VTAALHDCRRDVMALQLALTEGDAAGIIRSAEQLAASIVIVRDQPAAPDAGGQSAVMIGEIMALLSTAAVQVNMLRSAARQRFDNLQQLRGAATPDCGYRPENRQYSR